MIPLPAPEHRTTGPRAWCPTCQEWCYPNIPCWGCELPLLHARDEQAEAAVQRVRDLAEAAKRDTAQLFARQFGGAPFPATLRADDVLAALDQPEETS